MELSFFKDKKIFVTGHTGFKGSWLCKALALSGANVTGYALAPEQDENLFTIVGVSQDITSVIGDVRNIDALIEAFHMARPEIVFHLAAQPLVRESYEAPVYTYETNVMGTINLLECIRESDTVKSFVNVTTDKVYENIERIDGYKEDEKLCGFDPYSNSKSCSELVTYCYKNSFFSDGPCISTARAGNVIGGGDFSKDRIIPDCVRAAKEGKEVFLRNPGSVRPYQHVLECLYGYLLLAKSQIENPTLQGSYNFGPDEEECVTTKELAEIFYKYWNEEISLDIGTNLSKLVIGGNVAKLSKDNLLGGISKNAKMHEANYLRLDSTKAKKFLEWVPSMSIEDAVKETVSWSKAYFAGKDMARITDVQILKYFK